jgi:hypothetical protein
LGPGLLQEKVAAKRNRYEAVSRRINFLEAIVESLEFNAARHQVSTVPHLASAATGQANAVRVAPGQANAIRAADSLLEDIKDEMDEIDEMSEL